MFSTLFPAAVCSSSHGLSGWLLLLLGAAPDSPGSKQVTPACHVLAFGLLPAGRMLWPPPTVCGHQSPRGWDGGAFEPVCCVWAFPWALLNTLHSARCLSQVASDKFKKTCHSEGTGFWMIIFRFVQCLSWAIMNPSGVTATADWFFSGQPRLLKGSKEDLNSSSGLLPCAGGSKYWYRMLIYWAGLVSAKLRCVLCSSLCRRNKEIDGV